VSKQPKNWLENGNWRNAVFKDTQTGQKITINGIEKYLGKDVYKKAVEPFKNYNELKKIKIKYKGNETSMFNALRERFIERKTIERFGL